MSDAALWLGRLSVEIGSWSSMPRALVFNAEGAAVSVLGAWFELATEAGSMAQRLGLDSASRRFFQMRDGLPQPPGDDTLRALRELLELGAEATLDDVRASVESVVGQLRSLQGSTVGE